MNHSLKAKVKLIKPKPGDIFVVKRSIDVVDIKGNILSLPKDVVVTLIDIKDQNPSMRLDRNTKFIANWVCKFIYENRMFILRSQNTSLDSMFFEYLELVTEEIAERLQENLEKQVNKDTF